MKVLLLSTEFPPGPGGIGTHAYQLAIGLVKSGWEVTVLTPQDYADEEEILSFNSLQPFIVVRLRHYPCSLLEGFYRLMVLLRWFYHWSPDVSIASGERAVWLMALASLWIRHPWMAVGHGTEFGIQSSWESRLTRWAFGKASVIVAVSQYTSRRIKEMGIHAPRIYVIPNGADAQRFHPLPADRISNFRRRFVSEKGRILLTVGNVTERKGQDIVIRALPLVLKAGIDVHYLIVGLPTLREKLEILAQQLGVADRVHFLGRVDASTLVEAYNACDVFVMTSRYTADGDFEGYGIAVVEAALCGKPAVVSGGSGLEEAVLDGKTGLVVPQNDPAATASAIIKLLTDKEFYSRLAEQARVRALCEQTWEHRVSEYHRILCTLVGKSNKWYN